MSGTPRPSDRLRLGLVLDPEFVILEKAVCILTLPLVRALCRRFDTRIIHDQQTLDERARDVDFLISLDPGWAAPFLRWRRRGLVRRGAPAGPCYVMISDPHHARGRDRYLLDERLDFALASYLHPTLRNMPSIPPERIVHFPWAVPDAWISSREIEYGGSDGVMVFGSSSGRSYELRNWCRRQPGVATYDYGGVDNKVLDDAQVIEWIGGFDAVVAAGSDDPVFRLTVPKYFEIAAAGSLLFAQHTEDLEMLGFADMENCIKFTRENFREKVDEYRADPASERWLRIRRAGRELIRRRHSQSVRLDELEAHVRGQLGRPASQPSGD